MQEAAQKLGLQLVVLNGGSDEDIDAAFASLARLKVGALLVGADPSFDPRRNRLIAMVAQHAVPAIYQFRDYAVAGGLMSYGASIAELYQQVGIYVGRVLNGDKPGDMPVMLPAKFEMVINLKTAKALGIDIPPQLLAPRRRGDRMKRRAFIAALGGAAAWPLVARAQGERARRIVILSGLAENDPREQGQLAVFRDGLRKLGWLNGQNIQIETLWRAASIERATAFVAGLVQNPPDIVVAGTLQAFLAMRREAGAIPMVFINLPDPVVMGFVANLGKPEGNFTGFTAYEFVTAAKWVQTSQGIGPARSRIVMILANSSNRWARTSTVRWKVQPHRWVSKPPQFASIAPLMFKPELMHSRASQMAAW